MLISNSNYKDHKFLNTLLVILVILMPCHNLLFEYLIPGSIDNLWRDIVIVLCLLIVIINNKGNIKFGKYGLSIFLMWIIAIIYTLLSDRPQICMNLSRTFLIPTLIYPVMINCKVDKEFYKRLFVDVACVLSLWGIFQAFVLGDKFLINIGVPSVGGYLKNSSFYISNFFGQQRVVSTFSSPNICGVYFGIAFLVALSIKKDKKVIYKELIIIAGLITTFSRSAILGTILSFVFWSFYELKGKNFWKYLIIGIPISIIILFFIDEIFLKGLALNMLTSSIQGALQVTDPSTNKHIFDLWNPIYNILTHPFGLGYGHNGPIVLAQYGQANLVESSVYLIMYNFGIVGGLIFLFPCISQAFLFINRRLLKISGTISLLIFITYLMLPNIESYEVLFFLYFFIGICEEYSY